MSKKQSSAGGPSLSSYHIPNQHYHHIHLKLFITEYSFYLILVIHQAAKEAEASKVLLRDKECSSQALLTQLSMTQEECKRVRHQYQLLECSSAHTRLQNRLSSVSTTAASAAVGLVVAVSRGGHLATGATGTGALPYSGSVQENGGLLSDMQGTSPGTVPLLYTGVGIGTGAGTGVHLLTQELDKKKVQQQRYGIEAVLGLQASNDIMRQELYHEKGGRARDKTALSLALAEATARAVLADCVAADCR